MQFNCVKFLANSCRLLAPKGSSVLFKMEKKLNSSKVIGTHDGKFHCDEVLACTMLKMLPEYSDAIIRRSRDTVVLGGCDIVVDVGAEFNPANHRYDHHQRSFQETFSSLKPEYEWTTRLSSAGLVYLHFGQKILAHLLKTDENSELVQQTFSKVYENFIEEIDAIDNGISTHDGLPRYKVTTTLSSRVGNLNARWNEEGEVDETARFHQAMELVKTEFLDRVDYFAKSWWPARELVMQAMKERFEVDKSGRIMELSQGGCPWKEHLFTLEKVMGINDADQELLYVIFPDASGNWRIQGVPLASQSFQLRWALPEPWRGIRNEELDQLVGIEGSIFVHASGFIGGHKTRQGVLEMARKSLETFCKKSAAISTD